MDKEIKPLSEVKTRFGTTKFTVSEGLTRSTLQRLGTNVSDVPVELQIKEGFNRKDGTKFEVFKEKNDKINFRLKESNGNILLSGGGYDSLSDCLDAVESARKHLENIANFTELTPIRKKPVFVPKKAKPIYNSIAEEQANAIRRNSDLSFSIRANKRNRPAFITGRLSDDKVLSVKNAIHTLNYLHHTIGFENAEQEFPEEGVEIRRFDDTTFYRMKQYHKGIPVFAQTLILSTDPEGNTETLSGQYVPVSCNDDILISEERAKAIAEKESGKVLDSGGLIYYVDDNEKAYLCWLINTERYELYISTVNGTIVYKSPNIIEIDINTGRSITTLLNEKCEISILNKNGGSPYSLYDGARNIEIYDDFITEAAPIAIKVNTQSAADQAVLMDSEAVTAYANIRQVYDYYLNVLGRKGADGKGKKIRVVMNYHEYKDEVNACHYNTKDYTCICLGPNGGVEKCVDILGHEFTHGVNRHIWDPKKANQSGALNEAYADIMGEFVQHYTLDEHGENSDIGANRRFNNNYTMDDYSYEKPNEGNDYGHVHEYSQIISHAAYLIQDKWPYKMSHGMPSALFYRSMEYLGSKSEFQDCYWALLQAVMKITEKDDPNKMIGAIADAFLETRIMSSRGSGTRTVTGTITDKRTGEGAPGVTVEAYPVNSNKCETYTITNSKGEYSLLLKNNSKYTIKISRIDCDSGSVNTQAISSRNCGPFNFNTKRRLYYIKETFLLSGYVIDPDTKKTIVGATVKIIKGTHTESQVVTMKPEVVLKTDSNGYFFTAALPCGHYDVWAYAPKGSNYCLTKISHLSERRNLILNMTLEKKKRFYVTAFCVHSAGSEKEAKAKTESGYTLIDVDLNKNAGGDWIYLSYMVDNIHTPITNLLIYESSRAQTWTKKEITHKGIKAVYERINVDLNRKAKGKYLYICYTRDKRFSPLTQLDVIVEGKNVVREPYWSGVRAVRDSDVSTDSYADVNAGAGGSTIYIMQSRHEIL